MKNLSLIGFIAQALIRRRMTKEEIQDYVSEYNEEAQYADGFDEAFLGILERFGQSPLAAYDRDKCIDILMTQFSQARADIPEDNDECYDETEIYGEAVEYFEYNVIGAWVGEHTPVFVTRYVPNKS